MTATSLPEGTDSIIADDAVPTDTNRTPGFGATGPATAQQPATGAPSAAGSTGTSVPGDTPRATDAKGDAPTTADAKAAIGDAKAKIGDTAAGLKGQAADKAREYALLGKDRASESLHGFAKLIDDAAATVDDKIGSQYGDYARQASGYVKTFAAGIDEKDVDELFEQGRDLVRKSPAVALGIATALGFVATRIVKAGLEPVAATADDAPHSAA